MSPDHHQGARQQPEQDDTFGPLLRLPKELILHIIDDVDPASHLDFACTCKQIASCSSDVLQQHRDAYNTYRTSSDILPSTVPTLLRSACGLTSPIAAWHVRSFEVWSSRASWAEWKPYDLKKPPSIVNKDQDNDTLAWSFSKNEVKTYLALACELGCISQDQVDEARAELQHGQDSFIKMLLLALCPRLRDLKFITGGHADLDDGVEPTVDSLTWLESAIRHAVQIQSWPPGFLSLRDVAVGVSSGTWMYDGGSARSGLLLASLLRLPNIASIYFSDLQAEDDAEADDGNSAIKSLIPPGSSSVSHLYIDRVWSEGWDIWDMLLQAPRKLLSFAARGGADGLDASFHHVDGVVTTLGEVHAESLQSLKCYWTGPCAGYRCNLYIPFGSDYEEMFKALECIAIDLANMGVAFGVGRPRQDLIDQFGTLSTGIQATVILGDPSVYGSGSGIMRHLDDCLVRIMDPGNNNSPKEIFLEYIEDRPPPRRGTPEPGIPLCLPKVIAAGVEIHTRISTGEKKHNETDFPVAPDMYDVVSGLYGGLRKDDVHWAVNSYSGMWENSSLS